MILRLMSRLVTLLDWNIEWNAGMENGKGECI